MMFHIEHGAVLSHIVICKSPQVSGIACEVLFMQNPLLTTRHSGLHPGRRAMINYISARPS